MKVRITNVVSTLLSVFFAVGVMTLFRACAAKEDGTWMHCHYVQLYVFYLGIALVAVNASEFFVKGKIPSIILNAIAVVISGVAIALPFVLKMCKMQTMRCYTVMRPFVTIAGILVIVFALVNIVLALKSKK